MLSLLSTHCANANRLDRDNPFEYFNGDDDDIGANADTGMSDEIEMVQLPEKAKAEP